MMAQKVSATMGISRDLFNIEGGSGETTRATGVNHEKSTLAQLNGD
jgi:hypothetical protein